jgi:hypothetical protein
VPTLHETIMPNYDLLAWAEEANHRHRLLLRSCSLRPRHRRAAKEADELPASHAAAPGSLTVRGASLMIKEFCGQGQRPGRCGPRRFWRAGATHAMRKMDFQRTVTLFLQCVRKAAPGVSGAENTYLGVASSHVDQSSSA